jgi:hypothetical protein
VRRFRARGFPPGPAVPASLLDREEAISSSSREEALKDLQIAILVVCAESRVRRGSA